MAQPDYTLLERFAAGDTELLDAIIADNSHFVALLEQACERKKDHSEDQISPEIDPERFYHAAEMDMLLAYGIEQLFTHIKSYPRPWTILQQVISHWSKLAVRLQDDQYLPPRPISPNETVHEFFDNPEKEIDFSGERVSEYLISNCVFFLLKQGYEAYPEAFNMYEPEAKDIEYEMKQALEILDYPLLILSAEARKRIIIVVHGEEIVKDMALKEGLKDGPSINV